MHTHGPKPRERLQCQDTPQRIALDEHEGASLGAIVMTSVDGTGCKTEGVLAEGNDTGGQQRVDEPFATAHAERLQRGVGD